MTRKPTKGATASKKTTTSKATTSTAPTAKKPLRSSTLAVAKTPKTMAKVAPAVKVSPKEAGSQIELSKSDLVDRLMRQSDMKKGDARRALDATLLVLHEAISEGADISAAPLGKIKVARQKETNNGTLAVCRIKLKPTASDLPLASSKEDE